MPLDLSSLPDFEGWLYNLKDHLKLTLEADEEIKNHIENYYINRLFSDHIKNIDADKKFYRARIWDYLQTKNFRKEKMGAPPPDKAHIGRAQPNGISYLYTADTADTAASEIKPYIGAQITIGTFVALEKLKLLDISSPELRFEEIFQTPGGYKIPERAKFSQRFFSKPYHESDPRKYWDTIFVTDLIRKTGVDGLIFDSAQRIGGKNFLFFNPSKLRCITTKKYQVKSISVKIN